MSIPTNVRYYENDDFNALFIAVMNSISSAGVFNESALPDAVKERLSTVADTDALYALTVADVQNGDIVKVGDNDFYVVVDVDELDSAAGYVLLSSSNAATATKLATARKINGVDFDGSADISVSCVSIGETAPTDTGFIWIDTSASPVTIKHYVVDTWTTVLTSA